MQNSSNFVALKEYERRKVRFQQGEIQQRSDEWLARLFNYFEFKNGENESESLFLVYSLALVPKIMYIAVVKTLLRNAMLLTIALFIGVNANAQTIHFSHTGATERSLSARSVRRIERFLTHVFPLRPMERYARHERIVNAFHSSDRVITYDVISQEGLRFVLAAYTMGGTVPIHDIAIYRIENTGPNQVWRSKPWQGNFSDLHFSALKPDGRNLVLFQEGGNEQEFGLASIFTFLNEPDGLFIHDLTPELPWLRARSTFPLRALFAKSISMQAADKNQIFLRASDDEYNRSMTERLQPERIWKYNPIRERFENTALPLPAPATEARVGE